MSTPGSNTLRQALSIQGNQAFDYYQANGRGVNASGDFVSAFLPPVQLRGSVQAVQRSLYEQLGLDLQKNYVTLYVTKYLQDLSRGTQGDQFSWNGRIWQLESNVDWAVQDGWIGVLCCDQGVDKNIFKSLGFYTDPGVTDVSTVQFLGQSIPAGAQLVIDAPIWTVGNAYYSPLVFSGLTEGDTIDVNVSIGGVQQGSLTVTADGSGIATDAPGHYPGLSSYGVVAGGLRVQCNVRLTISSATVTTADIALSRGAD